jgi:hypothetical protein
MLGSVTNALRSLSFSYLGRRDGFSLTQLCLQLRQQPAVEGCKMHFGLVDEAYEDRGSGGVLVEETALLTIADGREWNGRDQTDHLRRNVHRYSGCFI